MKKMKEWTIEDYIKFVPPIIGGLIIIFVAVIFRDIGVIGVTCFFSLIVGSVPYFLFSYIRYREVSAMEDQLPNFLRDLVEEVRSGMTLNKAIQVCSNIDYGKLSREVKKMYYQLTWGTPLSDVLRMFSERVKESNLIKRSVDILIESQRSGGDIISTMESVARDSALVKEMKKERKSSMTYHTISLYMIYFMFIGVLIGLTKILGSMTTSMSEGIMGGVGSLGIGMQLTGPCSGNPVGITGGICSFLFGICRIFNLGVGSGCYYKAMFLYMILIQGLCSGLVAGQAGSESITVGFKHGLIMMGIGFPIFLIALKTGLI